MTDVSKLVRVDRKVITDLYVRVCRDSWFRLDFAEAAKITARVLGVHPLEVWTAVGDMGTMRKIADGSHRILACIEPQEGV